MPSSAARLKNIIIGQGLQEKRENINFSRAQVAERLKVLPQYVANWERGQCLPPKRVLFELKELYKMSTKEIVNLYSVASKMALQEFFHELEVEKKNK